MLVSVGAAAQELPAQQTPTLEEAVELARDDRHAEALAAFRRRASADPNDRVARLWIARLHDRMGHADLAEPVYRSVLLEDPSNVDAVLGVAVILLARGETKESLEILEAAEQRAPENGAILTLLGRAHRLGGRDARAITYFERAVPLESAGGPQDELEAARRSHLHRLEFRGFSEQFSGPTSDSRNGEVILNVRLTDTVRVAGRGEAQRKFGLSEQRGGGGLEWRWTPATTLRGQAVFGPDNLVLPEADYLGELDHLRGAAVWSVGVRHFDFTGARTTVFSPAVTWFLSDRLLAQLRYAASWTESAGVPGTETGHSAHAGGEYRLAARVWLHAGYAAGVEDFEHFSIDRIGNFRANTAWGGIRIPLPTLTTIAARYERQWRREDVDVGRVTVSLQQGF